MNEREIIIQIVIKESKVQNLTKIFNLKKKQFNSIFLEIESKKKNSKKKN